MADLTSEARGAVEAFNNADWDGARKYFADSTYTEFGTQRSVSGFDALLELMQGWKAAMPDVRGTVTGAAEEGQRVVLEIMWEGTQTGELVTEQGTIPASGNRQRTPAAWVFDYEGGQLRESQHYFDMLTFLRQIGAAQLRQVVGPACKPGSALTVVSGGHLLLSRYTPRQPLAAWTLTLALDSAAAAKGRLSLRSLSRSLDHQVPVLPASS
jgi:steroid delta-isomerase-like uncharacterized protein